MLDIGAASTVVLLVFVVVGAIGFLIGFFKGLFRSLLDLAFLMVNVFISSFIARLLANTIFDLEMIAENIQTIAPTLGLDQGFVNEIHIYLTSPDIASDAVSLLISFVSVIVLPIIFIAVFFVMGIILFIPKILIQKVMFSKPAGMGLKIGGGIAGFAAKIVFVAVLLVPIVGYANYAEDTMKLINSDENIPELVEIQDVLEEVTDTFTIRTIYALGGEQLFNDLTTINVDNVTVSLQKETDSAIKLYQQAKHFLNTEVKDYGSEQTDAIEEIEKIINDSEFVPAFIASTLSYVATEWKNGNKAFGFEKPIIGTELQQAVDSTVETLSTTTSQSLKADICSVAEIVKYAIDDGFIQAVSTGDVDGMLYVLENTDVISDMLVEMHRNERMRPVLPALTNGVVNYMYSIYEEVNGTTLDEHYMVDISGLTDSIVRQEGEIISNVITELDAFFKSIDGRLNNDVIEILKCGDFAALGRSFNGIKNSYLFCDTFEFMLKTVLESKGCAKLGILDEQFIINAKMHDSDMEMMLIARQKVTLMVISLHENQELDYDSAVEVLLTTITATDADSVKSIVTEENLNTIGIKGESAQTISGLLGSMVESIKKDDLVISEENIEKESESAGKVILAVHSAIKNSEKDKNVFTSSDEADTTPSTSNMSASDFVSTALESELVSSMVIEATKNSDGNEVDDPYNVKKHLSDNDIAELESALGEEYANAEDDEDTKEKLDAIAHIFGVDISKFQ